jgi:hypothetical protein
MAPDPDDDQRGEDDAAELQRLREEVAELRAAAATESGPDAAPGGDEGGAARRSSWAGRGARWTVSIVIVVLASLLTIVTVVARYVRSEVLDTDRYVETVSPLAREPTVQNAVADRVVREIVTRLDIESIAEDALTRLADLGAPEAITGLAGPIASQVESFTRDQVEQFVRSDEFARLWDEANRRAHTRVVAVLTGESGDGEEAVAVDEGAVTVDLGVIVSRVRDRLVDRGLDVAGNIPDVSSTFTLVESEQLQKAQRSVRVLDDAATLLPFVVVALAAVAILVAPNRRRALVAVALGVALSMVLLALALALIRAWYLSNATGEVLPKDAAIDTARTLLAPLRLAMRAVLALGLVVALGALLVGPSAPARGLRSLGGRIRAATRARLEGDREPSPVEAWIGEHKGLLRVAIIGLAALVLAFWTYPSGATVIGIVLVVVAALAVVELVGWTRPAATPPSSPAAG